MPGRDTPYDKLPGEADEWLQADGLGGYASGTVAGLRTRRYHALLLTATTPPTGRVVLVNGIEASVETAAGSFPITTQRYAPGVLHPRGFEAIAGFSPAPWPTWIFDLADGTQVTFEVRVHPDLCDTMLRWTRRRGAGSCRLLVSPLLSGRDYHSLHRENPDFDFSATIHGSNVSWHPYRNLPAITAITNGAYTHTPDWYRQFVYAAERERGLDFIEDLAAPGRFAFDLDEAGEAVIILRAGGSMNVRATASASLMARTAGVARAAPGSSLHRSARSYRVDRGQGSTLLAGFPWFTDWGRDTFIALRGLLIGLGDLVTAQAILTAWAGAVSQGMLPNRFPDAGETPDYNSVDASLWYVIAVHDFFAACEAAGRPVSAGVADRLRDACEAILAGYAAGTRFHISLDTDGLIAAGEPGQQLTWMDAKVGDWVVTPRMGKPVEVQALWINALHVAATRWAPDWAETESRARAAFAARFPNPAGGLYDVVDVDHIRGTVDHSIRPNQIFAVGGLPFPVMDGVQARDIVDRVEALLLTPFGLRTLSADDPAYVGRYGGDQHARDGAYHQGTVWPWLMGAFVDAWLAVRGRTEIAKTEGRERFLPPLSRHLETAGLGHISEVMDGDAPHRPGGCPFQAWSLGEFIRIQRMLDVDVP